MAEHPSAGDLIAAVREFIGGLTLDGRDAFHAKVAANALAIVERELGGDVATVESAALLSFRHPGTRGDDGGAVSPLRADLCAAIRAGGLTAATPGLLDALIVATRARLAVDNPRYSGPSLASMPMPHRSDERLRHSDNRLNRRHSA